MSIITTIATSRQPPRPASTFIVDDDHGPRAVQLLHGRLPPHRPQLSMACAMLLLRRQAQTSAMPVLRVHRSPSSTSTSQSCEGHPGCPAPDQGGHCDHHGVHASSNSSEAAPDTSMHSTLVYDQTNVDARERAHAEQTLPFDPNGDTDRGDRDPDQETNAGQQPDTQDDDSPPPDTSAFRVGMRVRLTRAAIEHRDPDYDWSRYSEALTPEIDGVVICVTSASVQVLSDARGRLAALYDGDFIERSDKPLPKDAEQGQLYAPRQYRIVPELFDKLNLHRSRQKQGAPHPAQGDLHGHRATPR